MGFYWLLGCYGCDSSGVCLLYVLLGFLLPLDLAFLLVLLVTICFMGVSCVVGLE